MPWPFGFLLARDPPSRVAGVITATGLVAACTAIVYPLKNVAPVVSLSVVYLPAVLVVSITWGLWGGVLTGVLSAACFDFFHLPPVGHLGLSDSSDWVALAAFVVVATLTSSVSEIARARTRDAEDRRREADLAAELARLLLGGSDLGEALPTAAARIAHALSLNSAAIETETIDGDQRTIAFPLRDGARVLGTLLVGADSSQESLRRLRERVVPALQALLGAALEREQLLAGAVEAAALRRADNVKTALLRSVSHDLRSPLTAISAAADALRSAKPSPEEHADMTAVIGLESERLSSLVDNLLELSRLQAGSAAPRREWCSMEELLGEAIHQLAREDSDFTLSIDGELPLVSLDPVQMERAFVNVLENARRHSAGQPVSVRARAVRTPPGSRAPDTAAGSSSTPSSRGDRVIVRIADRGPGIAAAQLERIFEPFYRAGPAASEHRGSGLGLAIARGFAEANGGTLHAESLPGQGASFVFELPLLRAAGQLAGGARRGGAQAASDRAAV